MLVLTPLGSFLLILIIGIIVGIAFDRFMGPGWLTRQIAGTRRHMVTSALVGIAGAFIGFHVSIIAGLGAGFATLIVVLIGALVVLWVWRVV